MTVVVRGVEETKARLISFANAIASEKVAYEALHAAAEPIAATARAYFQSAPSKPQYPHGGGPYNLTAQTSADIKVRDLAPSGDVIKVSVGGGGGKTGRGYVLHFLEHGTSHNRAYPVLRPAFDAERDEIVPRVTAVIRRLVGPLWREVFSG